MKLNKIFFKETIFNYIYKFALIGVGFISIPLLLNYLGKEKYGVWITILAIISWAQMSDFGIGNGLRNKITENLAKNDNEKIKQYISTSYTSLSIISGIIFIAGTSTIFLADINQLFNSNILENELKITMVVTLFSFCLNFILGLARNIAYGRQKSSLIGLSQVIYSSVIIGLLLLLKNYVIEPNLIFISLIYLLATTTGNIFISIIVFDQKLFRPQISQYNKNLFKDIFGIGLKFFLIQLSGIILFSTDSMIITKLLGPEEVSKYSLIDKIFSTVTSLHSILLVALWSGVAHAYSINDFDWIKSILKKLILTLVPLTIIILLLGNILNLIVPIWIGQKIQYDVLMIVVFMSYAILVGWTGINLNVINGIGKLNLQLSLYLIAAILNIPLSIVFVKNFRMGITGVKLATLICLLPIAVFIPLQVKQNINKKIKSQNWITA